FTEIAMGKQAAPDMCANRKEQLARAWFRGDGLRLDNPRYLRSVETFVAELMSSDLGTGDLTSAALGLSTERVGGKVIANAPGVAAGLDEYSWLMEQGGIPVKPLKKDGEWVGPGETLVEIEGERGD